jgi:RNA-binding protein
MDLSEAQKKFLRGLGHQLKPVIMIGDAGLSEPLLREFLTTITHHELIKVRIRSGDRASRDAVITELCQNESTHLISRVGNVALVYRPNTEKPKIRLPGK